MVRAALGEREGDDGRTVTPLDADEARILRRRSAWITAASIVLGIGAAWVAWAVGR